MPASNLHTTDAQGCRPDSQNDFRFRSPDSRILKVADGGFSVPAPHTFDCFSTEHPHHDPLLRSLGNASRLCSRAAAHLRVPAARLHSRRPGEPARNERPNNRPHDGPQLCGRERIRRSGALECRAACPCRDFFDLAHQQPPHRLGCVACAPYASTLAFAKRPRLFLLFPSLRYDRWCPINSFPRTLQP